MLEKRPMSRESLFPVVISTVVLCTVCELWNLPQETISKTQAPNKKSQAPEPPSLGGRESLLATPSSCWFPFPEVATEPGPYFSLSVDFALDRESFMFQKVRISCRLVQRLLTCRHLSKARPSTENIYVRPISSPRIASLIASSPNGVCDSDRSTILRMTTGRWPTPRLIGSSVTTVYTHSRWDNVYSHSELRSISCSSCSITEKLSPCLCRLNVSHVDRCDISSRQSVHTTNQRVRRHVLQQRTEPTSLNGLKTTLVSMDTARWRIDALTFLSTILQNISPSTSGVRNSSLFDCLKGYTQAS